MKLAAAPIAAVLALAALAAAPTAHAKTAVLKGEVTGQPWRVGTKTVVPVLLSARSAKRAKLRSPAGVLVLKGRSVRTPRGAIGPLRLRLADRVRTRTKIRSGHRQAPYWRIDARSLTVTKRSATLSAAELEALVAQLRSDLVALSKTLIGLATYTQNGFVKLNADITLLKAQIAALAAEIRRMGGTLPAGTIPLGAGGTPVVGELGETVENVETDLDGAVNTVTGTVGGLGVSLR